MRMELHSTWMHYSPRMAERAINRDMLKQDETFQTWVVVSPTTVRMLKSMKADTVLFQPPGRRTPAKPQGSPRGDPEIMRRNPAVQSPGRQVFKVTVGCDKLAGSRLPCLMALTASAGTPRYGSCSFSPDAYRMTVCRRSPSEFILLWKRERASLSHPILAVS